MRRRNVEAESVFMEIEQNDRSNDTAVTIVQDILEYLNQNVYAKVYKKASTIKLRMMYKCN